MSVVLPERFWSKVDRSGGPDSCWTWNAKRRPKGYGQFRLDGRIEDAHRLSWRVANGSEIPDGLQVLHSCDNPPCVNPAHLSIGTNALNVADKVAKARQARGAACAVPGERHGSAKLTELAVREIRARAAAGDLQRVIARDIGIGQNTVSKIVARRAWSHVA